MDKETSNRIYITHIKHISKDKNFSNVMTPSTFTHYKKQPSLKFFYFPFSVQLGSLKFHQKTWERTWYCITKFLPKHTIYVFFP